MPEIVLSTLNARFIHPSFGLRYLLANLGDLQPRACLLEFDIAQRPVDIAERILREAPRIVGLGVYIWNVAPMRELVATLKTLRPDITLILGGPEVSYEIGDQPIVQLADFVITGEADFKFAEVCRDILAGNPPAQKVIAAEPPDLAQVALPYELYTEADLAHRVVYVEASRGCPFSCEFCLSSLDVPVRQIPLPPLFESLQRLLERGARQFKFVDRTFNLNPEASRAVLEFLLERGRSDTFFHFEVVPDRLPESLRKVIARFPPGTLQLEVGIQTFNEQAADLVNRRQTNPRVEETLRFLRQSTGSHIHADLIAGLPGEDLASFAAGFDRLVALHPQEIQVGLLKRLRGAPIARHDSGWRMRYNPNPPYEILENTLIDFSTMQKIRRFARHWDLVGNSGNFVETTPLIWSGDKSAFAGFLRWSEWLHERVGRTDSIALVRLMHLLFRYLCDEVRLDPTAAANALWHDYLRGGRKDKPSFLKDFLPNDGRTSGTHTAGAGLKRQARFAGTAHPLDPAP